VDVVARLEQADEEAAPVALIIIILTTALPQGIAIAEEGVVEEEEAIIIIIRTLMLMTCRWDSITHISSQCSHSIRSTCLLCKCHILPTITDLVRSSQRRRSA
jgi:hypothetical protein